MATTQKTNLILIRFSTKVTIFHTFITVIVTAESILYPFGIITTCALKLMSQNEAHTLQG